MVLTSYMFYEFELDVTKQTWIKTWGDKHLKLLKTPNDQWLGPFVNCQNAPVNLNFKLPKHQWPFYGYFMMEVAY